MKRPRFSATRTCDCLYIAAATCRVSRHPSRTLPLLLHIKINTS